MSADVDVSEAILAKWEENHSTLTDLVPGGLHADTLPSPQPASPYAQLRIKQGPKPNEYQSNGEYIDYRDVRITIYGVGKEELGTIISAVRDVFDRKPLTVPNVVAHMYTQPLPDELLPTGKFRDGQEIYKATCRWSVWTHRSQG